MGINESKDLVRFGLLCGKAAAKALEDGKISIFDLRHLVPLLQPLAHAIDGIEQVPAEIRDLSPEEFQELLQTISDEFELRDERLEEQIQAALTVAKNIAQLAKSLLND